jgi:hypothetical protein
VLETCEHAILLQSLAHGKKTSVTKNHDPNWHIKEGPDINIGMQSTGAFIIDTFLWERSNETKYSSSWIVDVKGKAYNG